MCGRRLRARAGFSGFARDVFEPFADLVERRDGAEVEAHAVEGLGVVFAFNDASHEGRGFSVDEVDGDEELPADVAHSS